MYVKNRNQKHDDDALYAPAPKLNPKLNYPQKRNPISNDTGSEHLSRYMKLALLGL